MNSNSNANTVSIDDFRKGMQCLASGVCIVTTGTGQTRNGFTATAVMSLSDKPPSLVVSVGRLNRSQDQILDAQKFAVNTLEPLRQRWLQVCRTRGTPAPEPSEVARFLAEEPLAALEQALLFCLKGREKHRELKIVSWGASCTRPALLARVQAHGLACAEHDLFAAGLALMAQLASNPQDIELLRAVLGQHLPASGLAIKAQALPEATEKVRPVAPTVAGRALAWPRSWRS